MESLPTEEPLRNLMAEAIGLFIDAHARHQPFTLQAFNQVENNHALIVDFNESNY